MNAKLAAPFAAVLLALPSAAAAQQSVYKWVDKDGKVQYSDTPPIEAKAVTEKRMGGGGPGDGEYPYAVQQAMKRSPVTFYTAGPCGSPCEQGRDVLMRRGVPFAEKDPTKSAEASDALKALVGGLEVPALAVGSNTLKGFDEDQWNAALDSAGYPRTRLPGAPSGPIPSPTAAAGGAAQPGR